MPEAGSTRTVTTARVKIETNFSQEKTAARMEKDPRLAAVTAVMNAVKIVCVTYTDGFSAGGNAYNDLKIGLQAKTVACNSGHLSNTKAGDIVMIRSSKHITFGIIQEPVGTSDAWSSQGGEAWKYNFHYLPITAILEMDAGFKQMVRDHCEANGVKHGCMFNSRLCGYGEKYKPVLKDLFSDERMEMV
jgi:hypothetical protein